MDDIESKLSAIFSSPESMEQIRNIAKSLSGGEKSSAPPGGSGPEAQPDPRLMQLLTRAMSEYSRPSEAGSVISALRPYLSPERAGRLDKALSIARIAKIAKTVLPELGGDRRV